MTDTETADAIERWLKGRPAPPIAHPAPCPPYSGRAS